MIIKETISSTSFREYLYEQAFSKDVMISKFTNNSDNIFNHILKVLVYDDNLNDKKHLREMSGIVRSLQNKTIKSKITPEDLYHIFYGNIEEDSNLKQYILDLEINYGSLQKSKLSENEIHFRLARIFKRLSSEILTKSFKSFEKYPELRDRF
ncbi:hypothetical protein [Campylobacter phage CP21]|uniref:Uncharacterized protein n=1 Tax=Campylobacter phage CP21 TaxID=2881391 RepID=I7JVX2_9CAUD|nr:hypothetical protein F421_gp222 [Campylobacter phage CP21]CCH63684.1 hypothetical protein [Campylobacter phage CP21]